MVCHVVCRSCCCPCVGMALATGVLTRHIGGCEKGRCPLCRCQEVDVVEECSRGRTIALPATAWLQGEPKQGEVEQKAGDSKSYGYYGNILGEHSVTSWGEGETRLGDILNSCYNESRSFKTGSMLTNRYTTTPARQSAPGVISAPSCLYMLLPNSALNRITLWACSLWA